MEKKKVRPKSWKSHIVCWWLKGNAVSFKLLLLQSRLKENIGRIQLQWARKFKKVLAKKLVKSNTVIQFHEIFVISKMSKNQFFELEKSLKLQ